MRKTKIICTIGPASEDISTLRQLLREGMNIARLNFSHGSHEEHKKRIAAIRQAAKLENKVIAILLDTKGPEIRTGELVSDQVELKQDTSFTLTTEAILGDQNRVSISYSDCPKDVQPGNTILIDDGLIELEVLQVSETDITCRVVNGGVLKSRKGVNLPGIQVSLPGITDQDAEDIRFGIEQEVDFIAASFVRKADDVFDIRKIVEQEQAEVQIIAKIENEEGLDNLDQILSVSDGLMVARGDLGVEIPAEEVPLVQKRVIQQCNRLGKPVITATQMLDSMQRNPRPTRAEASDVANAIFDGTDAIMLSGETAAGKYPIEAVITMATIAERTEAALPYRDLIDRMSRNTHQSITESISQAVVHSSHTLDCAAIITSTERGYTARMVAKYRPSSPIIAVTPHESTLRKLSLVWGVHPVMGIDCNHTDEMFQVAIHSALTTEYVKQGDLVVITAGVPLGQSGTTNLMKIYVVGGTILQGTGLGRQVVTGKVVVGETAEEIREQMEDGAIIVTRFTDKDMIDSFMRAGAVITEEGGLTSHAAVVGINLGIPVVVGVPMAMQRLQMESIVTIDSNRGSIYSGKANVF